MLALSVCIVAAAVLLQADGDRVSNGGIPALTLPPLCGSKVLFDRECPACGMTRSFIYLAHGDLPAAYAANRAGWLLALAVLLQIPYRIVALRCGVAFPLGPLFARGFGFPLLGALFGIWLLKMVGS